MEFDFLQISDFKIVWKWLQCINPNLDVGYYAGVHLYSTADLKNAKNFRTIKLHPGK